jgi:TPP-dependent pyruvate/acetoin dehydrogenase alpha subunit
VPVPPLHDRDEIAGTSAGEPPVHSILQADGTLAGEAPLGVGETLAALRLMMLTRQLDRRMVALSRRDEIGTYTPLEGQEASVLGSAMALDPDRDWIVPSYREQAALLRHGLPLDSLVSTYYGRIDAARIPEGLNILTRQQAIGAQLPQAAGLAWGLKLTGRDAAVIVYFGEGASSEGDFHEACNLAGVTGAPLVFFLQNNGWAISTPVRQQTAAASLASRSTGYGFPGTVVDGNDLFAVYDATREAIARARAGAGPTLIESRCYRMGMHNTADNPRMYRDEVEVAAARARDPIARVRAYLAAQGALTDEDHAALEQDVAAELGAAIDRVRKLPRPDRGAVFDHVYASLPPHLARQRDDLGRPADA